MIAPEIARKYHRAQSTIQRKWTQHPDWPAPIGKRGRWHEYDADQVDALVHREFLRSALPAVGEPDDLLTIDEIAAYTGLAAASIRSESARGRWRPPDDEQGVRRWKRRTVDEIMAARRSYHRRTGRAAG